MAVLLARGGLRTTLQTRTDEQASQLREDRENRTYLAGVDLPRELRIEPLSAGLSRADYVFLSVPSTGLREVIEGLEAMGLSHKAVITLAKGLVPPDGAPPTERLARMFGPGRTGCVGGPAHAREMVSAGAGLVAASVSESLATEVAGVFIRAGVVCEESGDPIGVELAGVAKNAAALASGATVAQVEQAIEALDTVPLLAKVLAAAGMQAPVTDALARLIEGALRLDEWVDVVRTRSPRQPGIATPRAEGCGTACGNGFGR